MLLIAHLHGFIPPLNLSYNALACAALAVQVDAIKQKNEVQRQFRTVLHALTAEALKIQAIRAESQH